MKISKKNKTIIFTFFIAIISGIFDFIYFYKVSDNYYLADIAPHVDAAKSILELKPIVLQTKRVSTVAYPLFHVLTAVLSIFLHISFRVSAAVVLAIHKILLFIVCIYIERDLNFESKIKKVGEAWKLLGLLGMTYIASIPLTGKLYLPQGSPNVWHNPTYIVMQPYALLLFYFTYKCLTNIKDVKKDYLLFSLMSVVSCVAKPSYTVIIIPVIFIYCLYTLLNNNTTNIKKYFWITVSLFPTIGVLVFQYYVTFSSSVSTGIKFGTFLNLNLIGIILATLAIITLPLVYCVTGNMKFCNPQLILLAVSSFLVGWLQYFFLYEKGNADGNFAWGYFMSIFVMYFCLFVDYIQNPKKLRIFEVLFLTQVLVGLTYFARLLTMHLYI